MTIRNKNALLLAKIESTSGVDASPVAATDALLVLNPSPPKFSVNNVQTNELSGSLDGLGPLVGGKKAEITFEVYLKGSGTAGTPPEYADLLKACGMAETILGTALPVSAEACAAGGSTTSAILGVSASTTAQAYRGMPINLTGVAAGNSFISDYTSGKAATLTDTMGAAIVATTSYQIPANVVYGPASNNIPSLTMYYYIDGIRYRLVGCRGQMNIKLDTNGVAVLQFTFMGMFLDKADASMPASPVFDATRPPIFLNGKCLINRLPAATRAIQLSDGMQLVFPDDPNAVEGINTPEHTSRRWTGSMDPLETLVATRDLLADMTAGTSRIMHARFGQVAGNRVGITIPQARFTQVNPGDRDGMATNDVQIECVGRESGIFICLY